MNPVAATPLTTEQLHEVDSWIGANLTQVPESVAAFLTLHRKYLTAGQDLRRRFNATLRELRRALGITPSSERCRSGSPLASVPAGVAERALTPRQRLEQQRDHSLRLGDWHDDLQDRHTRKVKRIEEKLAKMEPDPPPPPPPPPHHPPPPTPPTPPPPHAHPNHTPVAANQGTGEERARPPAYRGGPQSAE